MTTFGMIDASTTRRPATARNRPSGSTGASTSAPIRTVPEGWYDVPSLARTKASSSASLVTSGPGVSSPRL